MTIDIYAVMCYNIFNHIFRGVFSEIFFQSHIY